jgi:hypothetical protein
VVASLVRSNSKGTVGFLRETERINVLLSRARDGLILIGNTKTLRNASSTDARKHWGVVLDQLGASHSIVAGLPAVCQRHSRNLGLLDSPEAFALHAPDGGCTMPCNATLPCGHAGKWRCHAYDAQHEKQKCEELVLELCEQGHITTRHCWQAEAVCSTCVDIRQLLEEEKKHLRKLVRGVGGGVMACCVQALCCSMLIVCSCGVAWKMAQMAACCLQRTALFVCWMPAVSSRP